jgi:pimeloyl-ACP methyl ester carboxylesterase
MLMAGVALGCGEPARTDQPLVLTPCRLEGLGMEARCGEHLVFENRRLREGRRLSLRVAVVPALAASPRPDPLFVIVGGPGQAATKAGAQIAEALRDVRRKRDIVLVDQRGTGGSHPLDCEDDKEQPLAKRFAPKLDLAKTRACLSGLDADTTQYSTPVAMDDLDEVRRALGYAQINLWGGSYGTRAALVYLRQHPKQVRSLVLDGTAPVAIKLPLFVARDGQRALDLLYADCEADQDCRVTFPGAKAKLAALLARLAEEAHVATVTHPRTGAPEGLRIEREGLASVLLNLLYVPQLAGLIPLGVERASRGDFSVLVASAEAFSGAVSLSTGMFLSIVCAEDVPRISALEAAEQTRGTFLGGEWLARLHDECAEWRSAELPASYFDPITSEVPSLVLSGNLDPVTPPVWGELVSHDLSSSRHIVVPGAGHGVSSLGCMPRLIDEFLDLPEPALLDVSCIERLERPAFFTSLAGPSP